MKRIVPVLFFAWFFFVADGPGRPLRPEFFVQNQSFRTSATVGPIGTFEECRQRRLFLKRIGFRLVLTCWSDDPAETRVDTEDAED